MSLDVAAIREQFQFQNAKIDGNPLVHLDNAATTQKPQVLSMRWWSITLYNSNVHRCRSSTDEATRKFEHARDIVKDFINEAKA